MRTLLDQHAALHDLVAEIDPSAEFSSAINDGLVPTHCVRIDYRCGTCYIYHMPSEKNTALNVRVVPEELIRKAKSQAALQGKTLREWIIEAIQEKLRRSK